MSQVNLQELASPRSARPMDQRVPRRRNWIARYLFPGAILGGFLSVLGWSLYGSMTAAKIVTVVPVMATRSEVATADTPLFQSAGWVEPRPQPVIVSALTEGIVDEMLVVEGEPLEPGQIVARLIRRDAEIELQRSEADVRLREAELKSTQAARAAAKSLFKDPLPLRIALAEAEAALSKIQTDLSKMPALMRAAESRRDFAEKDLEGKTNASDVVPLLALQRAKSEVKTAEAQYDEYRQHHRAMKREEEAVAKRCDVLSRQLELKIEETRQLADTEAKVQAAEALLQQAIAHRDAAQLKLERTDVRAKTGGTVLALLAKPGSRMMGINQAAVYDASTVITMYDPAKLQVRADVRLDDVPQVIVGQSVKIETPAVSHALSGRVLMATALTDIQKNTLQIKIALDDPPAVIKPDMLVQVTFLAPARPSAEGDLSRIKLLAPQELVQGTGSDATVWIADQSSGRAKLRRVSAGAIMTDGLREISAGLNVGDRLIAGGREALSDGDRIRIVERDRSTNSESTSEKSPLKSSQIPRTGT